MKGLKVGERWRKETNKRGVTVFEVILCELLGMVIRDPFKG